MLLLDYDGTLAPFHRRPERALPYPEVGPLLKRAIERCRTRVIIVSGRRLADLRGPLARVPHDEAWASHGWERFGGGGERSTFVPSTAAQRQLEAAEAAVRELAMHGARVERKVASVAVHWRGLSEPLADRVRLGVERAWCELDGTLLEVLDFEAGTELRARGRNKGDAVREILAQYGTDDTCAYLGDDHTDEDAFDAMHAHEGGLAVLVREELRETGADAWLRPPEELVAFLERWCACGAVA